MRTKLSIIALLGALTACTPSEQAADVNRIEDPSAYVVQSFPLDVKEYRYVELDNGIRTLVISDPNAVKAAASLNVDVGSFHDPEEWNGLAHFLEHMLFLGTEKYPESDAYMKYLDAHGGSRNAYTAFDLTNYHFQIDANAFEGALDRFAQFFIAPLFTEKYVDREKNAVHSEYFTRINKDQIRNLEVFENVINPEHPGYKFNAGNLDTLADKPNEKARDVLIDFYNKYYSADHMTLVLTSNESLDALEKLARDKFSAVPVLNNVPKIDFPPLFNDGELPKIVEIKPVQEQRTLMLTFQIPVQEANQRENPVGFVARMLTAEGENSLQDRLKAKGWIEGIQASPFIEYGSTDTFMIAASLTQEGMNHQDEIIASLFDQIELVKKEGVQEWRYNEIKNLSEMGFRFSENSSLGMQGAINMANALQKTLPRDLISAGFQRFDAKLINEVLDSLRTDNMLVTLVAPSVEPEKETQFYGAEYRTYQPSAERVSSWGVSQYNDLSLPERNPLIPENFDLVDVQTAEQPTKLDNTKGMEVWHYPNIEDGIPRATVQFAIDRPERPGLEEQIVSSIYFGLMNEQLEDLKFRASQAGVGYSVNAGGISFSGYSDKLSELSDMVLAEVLNPQFTQQQFDRLMERYMRFYRNYNKVEPTRGVSRELDELLDAESHSVEEAKAVVESITLEKVMAAPQWLFGESRMQMMASGNITESQTRDFAKRIVDTLGVTSTDKDIPKGMKVVRLEQSNSRPVYLAELEHQDTAVMRYYQGRESTREERIKLSLLGQMMTQYYFNDLRTEQQLGYIVQAGAKATDRTPGVIFIVQSPTADANTVEKATDAFLPKFKQVLANSEKEFESVKQATLAQLRQPPQNMGQKVGQFWGDLRDDYPNFDSREQAIAVVEATTLQDLQKAYQEVIMDNPHAISVIAPGAKGGVKATVKSAQEFRKGKEVIERS